MEDKKKAIIIILIIGLMISVISIEDTYSETTYGEMWGRHITNTTISASNTYYNITDLNCGDIKEMNCNNSKLIIQQTGMYRITGQFSFSDGGNTEFHLALGENGTRNEHCHTERKIGTGGDVGSASFTCIDQLYNNDEITVMIENVDNTNDPFIHSINLNLNRIG